MVSGLQVTKISHHNRVYINNVPVTGTNNQPAKILLYLQVVIHKCVRADQHSSDLW